MAFFISVELEKGNELRTQVTKYDRRNLNKHEDFFLWGKFKAVSWVLILFYVIDCILISWLVNFSFSSVISFLIPITLAFAIIINSSTRKMKLDKLISYFALSFVLQPIAFGVALAKIAESLVYCYLKNKKNKKELPPVELRVYSFGFDCKTISTQFNSTFVACAAMALFLLINFCLTLFERKGHLVDDFLSVFTVFTLGLFACLFSARSRKSLLDRVLGGMIITVIIFSSISFLAPNNVQIEYLRMLLSTSTLVVALSKAFGFVLFQNESDEFQDNLFDL